MIEQLTNIIITDPIVLADDINERRAQLAEDAPFIWECYSNPDVPYDPNFFEEQISGAMNASGIVRAYVRKNVHDTDPGSQSLRKIGFLAFRARLPENP